MTSRSVHPLLEHPFVSNARQHYSMIGSSDHIEYELICGCTLRMQWDRELLLMYHPGFDALQTLDREIRNHRCKRQESYFDQEPIYSGESRSRYERTAPFPSWLGNNVDDGIDGPRAKKARAEEEQMKWALDEETRARRAREQEQMRMMSFQPAKLREKPQVPAEPSREERDKMWWMDEDAAAERGRQAERERMRADALMRVRRPAPAPKKLKPPASIDEMTTLKPLRDLMSPIPKPPKKEEPAPTTEIGKRFRGLDFD